MTTSLPHTDLSRPRWTPFFLYLVLFHVVWIGWVYGIYPWMLTLGEASFTYAIVNIGLRALIWVAPVLFYVKWIDRVDPLVYLKLTAHWRRGVWTGLALSGLNLLLFLAQFGMPHPTRQAITWNSILSTSLFIGVIEEIPFRGFILQKLQERVPFVVANLLTSLLFVGIHLPGWLALHLFQINTVVSIFIFSILMGVIFRYSRSLWSVIIIHSLNDFLAGVLFWH